MNENIIVKNNAGTTVICENVDSISLPTADGSRAVFKRWKIQAGAGFGPEIRIGKKNVMVSGSMTEPEITIELGVHK